MIYSLPYFATRERLSTLLQHLLTKKQAILLLLCVVCVAIRSEESHEESAIEKTMAAKLSSAEYVDRLAAISYFEKHPARKHLALILGLLDDKGFTVRLMAARTLAQMPNDAETIVPKLIDKLKTDVPGAASSYIQALSAFGERSKQSIPVILDTLTREISAVGQRSSAKDTVRECVAALKKIDLADEAVQRFALSHSDDSNSAVREAARALLSDKTKKDQAPTSK